MSGPISQVIGGAKNLSKMNKPFQWPGKAFLNIGFGWGPGCEKEVKLGRAGICSFNFDHLAAAQQFGYDLSDDEKAENSLKIKNVQFVAVNGDAAVDNNRINNFYKKLVHTETTKSICLYRKPANHSLGSRFDAPNEDKFWMQSYNQDALSYITKGTFFRHGSQEIIGHNECFVD